MNPNYWPRVYTCPYCGTTSNASICPRRSCIEADFQNRQRSRKNVTRVTDLQLDQAKGVPLCAN